MQYMTIKAVSAVLAKQATRLLSRVLGTVIGNRIRISRDCPPFFCNNRVHPVPFRSRSEHRAKVEWNYGDGTRLLEGRFLSAVLLEHELGKDERKTDFKYFLQVKYNKIHKIELLTH